jgi:YggT family protein
VPVGDAIDTAQSFVNTIFLVYLVCVFLYIIQSWIPVPYNPWLSKIQRFLYDIVNPYLSLFRRFLPTLNLGGMGLDLSPILGILVLYVIRRLIVLGLEELQ